MIATSIGSNDNEKINNTTKIINSLNKKIVYITTVIIGIAMLISLPYFLIEKESLIIIFIQHKRIKRGLNYFYNFFLFF